MSLLTFEGNSVDLFVSRLKIMCYYELLPWKGNTVLYRLTHICYRSPNSVSQAHLVPTDEISVHYRCQPDGDYLNSVVQAHTDFIMGTTKAPLLPFPVPKSASVIIAEKTQVWWTDWVFQTYSFRSEWYELLKNKVLAKISSFFLGFCDDLSHICDCSDACLQVLFFYFYSWKTLTWSWPS